MTAIHDMTAGELLAAYKSKSMSPVEAVDAVIARIEAWEPKLKALYAPDFEGARKAAKASEARWQKGTPQGALDGVPITIKENIATKGVPVPLGTAATELVPAADDAPASARVRARVARPVGTPAASMMRFANAFEPSSCAAALPGPKTGMPRSRRLSATPATSGASGPITTRSMRSSLVNEVTAAGSFGSTSTIVASRAMPALPGAANTSCGSASERSERMMACSRAPEPRTRILTPSA